MSFPRYEAYKDGGVEWLGEVPSHWQIRPVVAMADVINGFPFDSTLFNLEDGFPLIRIRELGASVTECFYRGESVTLIPLTQGVLYIVLALNCRRACWRHG